MRSAGALGYPFPIREMSMTLLRRMTLGTGALAAALLVPAAAGPIRQQAPTPEITVYKGPT